MTDLERLELIIRRVYGDLKRKANDRCKCLESLELIANALAQHNAETSKE